MAGAKKSTTTNKPSGTKDSKKSKKDKGEGGPRKAEITVMVNEKQAMKIIQNSKVVTVQESCKTNRGQNICCKCILKRISNKRNCKKSWRIFRALFVSSCFFIET